MMEERNKRPYNSRERAARASATAAEIARVARRLFEQDGYAAVTMKDIAAAAGVAPATVYLHFSSKAKIVEALALEVTGSADLSVEQLEGELPLEEQLRRAASILRQLNERSWLVVEIFRTHAGADEELKALGTEWQRRHLDAVTRGVEAVARARALRPGLAADEAIDVLYAIGGTDLYRALVRERGWTPERYEAWLVDFLVRDVLGSSDPPAGRTSADAREGMAAGLEKRQAKFEGR